MFLCRLIYGVELAQEVSDIHSNLKNGSIVYPTFSSGPPSQRRENIPSTIDLNDHLGKVSKDPVPQEIQDSIGFKEKLLFIYTSGTTGLPKVRKIPYFMWNVVRGYSTVSKFCIFNF